MWKTIFLLTTAIISTSFGCLPGLGGGGGAGGGGGGACCAPPSSHPLPVAPAAGGYPVAPFASNPYVAPFAAGHPPPPPPPPQPQSSFGGFGQQTGGGGQYFSDPVSQGSVYASPSSSSSSSSSQSGDGVQPLPLLGQPVGGYQNQQQPSVEIGQQVLNTAQVVDSVQPASAVLEQRIVQPTEVAGNQVVSSFKQTSYGDESHQNVENQGESVIGTAIGSNVGSADHTSTHQIIVPSATSAPFESNVVAVQQPTFFNQQSTVEDVAQQPLNVAPVAPVETVAPVAPIAAPYSPVAPVAPVAPVETVAPVAPIAAPYSPVAPAASVAPVAPAAPVAPVAPFAPIVPVVSVAPTNYQAPYNPQTFNSQPSIVENVHTTFTEPEDRSEFSNVGNDYDQQPSSNDHAAVNELVAALEQDREPTSTVASSNLDFNQVTISPPVHTEGSEQSSQILSSHTDAGSDYDAPLNEDRKDVPAISSVTIAPQPVANVPEESAPIIPQSAITQNSFDDSTATPMPAFLQPIAPAVRVDTPVVPSVPISESFAVDAAVPEVHAETSQHQETSNNQNVVDVQQVSNENTEHSVYVTPNAQNVVEVQEVISEGSSSEAGAENPQQATSISQNSDENKEVINPSASVLIPEPATIQTIQPYQPSETAPTVAPAQFFENITSADVEENTTIQSEPAAAEQEHHETVNNTAETSENDANEHHQETVIAPTPTPVEIPQSEIQSLNEYGSKVAKVRGAETKKVEKPIEISQTAESLESSNPYARRVWIV